MATTAIEWCDHQIFITPNDDGGVTIKTFYYSPLNISGDAVTRVVLTAAQRRELLIALA